MKPLDNDLRKRIVGTMQEAGRRRAVAQQFRAAASTRRFMRSLGSVFKIAGRGVARLRRRETSPGGLAARLGPDVRNP